MKPLRTDIGMSEFEIRRVDTTVLWKGEADTVKTAVLAALAAGADLTGADLAWADLTGADLTRAYLRGATLTGADLTGATLRGATLIGADLTGADLAWADLTGADLTGAYLRGATLTGADLTGATLRGATLIGAIGCHPWRVTPLLMLLDQPGIIHAYKLVTKDSIGPFNGDIAYDVGQSYRVSDANTDPLESCGAGINVATLDWCLREYQPGYRVLMVSFTAQDIACIPTATDGKFRLHRCTVVAEKDISALVTAEVGHA